MDIAPVAQPNIFRITRAVASPVENERLALPVDRSVVMYSRLKHVHGVPSPDRANGMPLSKLRALDNLIDRLVSLRNDRPAPVSVNKLAPADLDDAIRSMQRSIHNAVSQRPALINAGGPSNDLGLALNIVA